MGDGAIGGGGRRWRIGRMQGTQEYSVVSSLTVGPMLTHSPRLLARGEVHDLDLSLWDRPAPRVVDHVVVSALGRSTRTLARTRTHTHTHTNTDAYL